VKGSAEPIGMAVYSDDGIESTIGGNDGQVVVATNASELSEYAGSSEPLYIIVDGSFSGKFEVGSNKTLIGAGSGATIDGQLSLNNVQNVIIRNFTVSGGSDGISTNYATHVWIDHCDVSNCSDGAIDITDESDYHTVSWTRLHDHHKTMLLNSGTGQPEDADDFNITLHHNWWDGTQTRNPRAAYGAIHVFNCLYNNNGYCIGLHSRCMVLSENNYFVDTSDAISQMYDWAEDPSHDDHGFAKDVGSIFVNTEGNMDVEPEYMTVDFNAQFYMYDFALDPAEAIPDIVREKAGPGPEYSSLGPLPIPGNGAIGVSANVLLRWTRGHNAGEATSYDVYFGAASPPPKVTSTTEKSYSPGSLTSGTVYYWRVDQVTDGGTVPGSTWIFRTE
jgi:pectate lyase